MYHVFEAAIILRSEESLVIEASNRICIILFRLDSTLKFYNLYSLALVLEIHNCVA